MTRIVIIALCLIALGNLATATPADTCADRCTSSVLATHYAALKAIP